MSTNPKIFIKRLIKKLNDKDLIIEQQKSFIQQQDKMLELAIKKLFILPDRDECPDDIECLPRALGNDSPDIVDCLDCWRKYLQSEVSK